MLDKKIIKKHIIKLLEGRIADLTEVVDSVTSEVTSGDNKQESKYDTRAIEASYLAGAQKARLETLRRELSLMKLLNIEPNDELIKVGSLVKILKNQQDEQYFFFTPQTGGERLKIGDIEIITLSMTNPLSREFVGLDVGEEFLFEQTNNEYEVLVIF
jgi:transcription elongation GreA/GreB family factor